MEVEEGGVSSLSEEGAITTSESSNGVSSSPPPLSPPISHCCNGVPSIGEKRSEEGWLPPFLLFPMSLSPSPCLFSLLIPLLSCCLSKLQSILLHQPLLFLPSTPLLFVSSLLNSTSSIYQSLAVVYPLFSRSISSSEVDPSPSFLIIILIVMSNAQGYDHP